MCMIDGYHVCKITLVDLYVDIESPTEGRNFHVISIGASSSHLSQMPLKNMIDLFRSRSTCIELCGESTGILSLRVPPYTTPWMNIYKLLVEIGMLTHVMNCGGAYLAMPRLISVELVRESIEQAVT